MNKTMRYTIAAICMLLFIALDLTFDYGFQFESSNYISFVFTLLSALIVFVCTGKLANDKYYKATNFVKSNFDKVQVIFSVLDVICGIISIIAGITFLFAIKVIKIVYVPVKILDVANKCKTLLKPLTKFSLMWTATRSLEIKINKGEGMKFKEFVSANKWTIIIGFVLSLILAAAAYIVIPTFVELPLWVLIIIAVVIFALAYAGVFFLGKDTVEGLALREAKKVLNDTKYKQLVDLYNNLCIKEKEEQAILKAAEEKIKIEKAQAAEKKKEEKTVINAKEQAEFNAKVQAKVMELKQQEIQKQNEELLKKSK